MILGTPRPRGQLVSAPTLRCGASPGGGFFIFGCALRLPLPVQGVAQLGRARGLGPRGRRFESCHPDWRNDTDGATAMRTPTPMTFRVLRVVRKQRTRKGNLFLECESDIGRVAFWGTSFNEKNISVVEGMTLPRQITAGCIQPSESHLSIHAWWVPEGSPVEKVDEVNTSDPVEAGSLAAKLSEPVSIEELARWRRELLSLLNKIEHSPSAPQEGIGQRIGRLVRLGSIPRSVGPLMRTITELRNAAEYESKVLSDAESSAARSAWAAILEWAASSGFGSDA